MSLEPEDQVLTESQALMMAYVDDELTPEERTAFEDRLAEDPELAAEVASYQSLMGLTGSMAVMEPTDHEIRRFWSRFYNRTEWRFGWLLLSFGLLVSCGYGLYYLLVSETVHVLLKVAVLSIVLGGGTLIWNTLRLKLRTSRFDRYRGVLR